MEAVKKITLTRDEVAIIIASTYHQYRAETEEGGYKNKIKAIHKKLSKFVNQYSPIDIELEDAEKKPRD